MSKKYPTTSEQNWVYLKFKKSKIQEKQIVINWGRCGGGGDLPLSAMS